MAPPDCAGVINRVTARGGYEVNSITWLSWREKD
jgi:hypothetical protein